MKRWQDLDKKELLKFIDEMTLNKYAKFNNVKDNQPFNWGIYQDLGRGKQPILYKNAMSSRQTPEIVFKWYKHFAHKYVEDGFINKKHISDVKKAMMMVNLALNNKLILAFKQN